MRFEEAMKAMREGKTVAQGVKKSKPVFKIRDGQVYTKKTQCNIWILALCYFFRKKHSIRRLGGRAVIHESFRKGRCCCLCRFQVIVKKHPWNKGKAKGSILQTMGYGCGADEDFEAPNRIIFSDSKHGDCEMFTAKEVIK